MKIRIWRADETAGITAGILNKPTQLLPGWKAAHTVFQEKKSN